LIAPLAGSPPILGPAIPAIGNVNGSRIEMRQISEKIIENQCFEICDPLKNWIVRKKSSGFGMHGSCGLQGVGCSQAMKGANFGGACGDVEVRRNPLEVGVSRKQPKKLIYPQDIAVPVWVDQEFRHRDR